AKMEMLQEIQRANQSPSILGTIKTSKNIYDSQDPSEKLKIHICIRFTGTVKKVECFLIIHQFDKTNSGISECYLDSKLYHNHVGMIVFDYTPTDMKCNEINEIFLVTIGERDETSHLKYQEFITQLGYPGLQSSIKPKPSSNPYSLQLKLLCRYQLHSNGNTDKWHWAELSSEALVYLPKPPTVSDAQPYDITLKNGDIVEVLVHFSRPIITGHDNLTGVTLTNSDKVSLVNFELNGHRLRLKLTKCTDNHQEFTNVERFFVTICLHGNSNGVEWKDIQSTIIIQLPMDPIWTSGSSSAIVAPPSLWDRRNRPVADLDASFI
ncbi:hypothetical protein BOX15_Mlig023151g1, partial [Macrostomum lignano]